MLHVLFSTQKPVLLVNYLFQSFFYMFAPYFICNFLFSFSVDATAESSRLGRLVNHSRAGNLMPKIIEIKDRPHLLLVARVDILPGEELLYDYGDRSRDSLKHHPWLAC